MDNKQLKYIIEAALLAAGRPLDVNELRNLFGTEHPPEREEVLAAIAALETDYAERGIEIRQVASGYRIQIRATMASLLGRLWEERAPRYSRALMETLAIIAYRQPVTRGDVEEIRGVSVTTNIMRTLLERNWIRVVGFRDVPGRPAMYGTTREFLDYFGLRKLDDLPALADLRDMESLGAQLEFGAEGPIPAVAAEGTEADEETADMATDATPGTAEESESAATTASADADLPDDEEAADGADGDVPDNVIPLKAR